MPKSLPQQGVRCINLTCEVCKGFSLRYLLPITMFTYIFMCHRILYVVIYCHLCSWAIQHTFSPFMFLNTFFHHQRPNLNPRSDSREKCPCWDLITGPWALWFQNFLVVTTHYQLFQCYHIELQKFYFSFLIKVSQLCSYFHQSMKHNKILLGVVDYISGKYSWSKYLIRTHTKAE